MDKSETKFLTGFIVVILVLMVGGIFLFSKDNPQTNTPVSGDKLTSGTKNFTGSKKAKVTLVEFSDYECPACGAVNPVVKKLLKKYPNKIRFYYHYFPLPQHPESELAAFTSEAAGKQGKFWEMHDKLFENQKSLKKEDLLKYAKDLKLDMNKFQKDLVSSEVKQQITADLALGTEIGINQTPTFFLNGIKMDTFSVEAIEKVIVENYAK